MTMFRSKTLGLIQGILSTKSYRSLLILSTLTIIFYLLFNSFGSFDSSSIKAYSPSFNNALNFTFSNLSEPFKSIPFNPINTRPINHAYSNSSMRSTKNLVNSIINKASPDSSPRSLYKSSSTCKNLLQGGKYIWADSSPAPAPDTWQPENCVLKMYDSIGAISDCLRPGDQLIFYGDSTARQVYWATANLLDSSIGQDFGVHGNHHINRNGISLKLYWDPFLNTSNNWPMMVEYATKGIVDSPGSTEALSFNKDPLYRPKAYLYATTGLWHAMFERPERILEGYQKSVSDFVNLMNNRVEHSFDKVFFGPVMLPHFALLDRGRKKGITQKAIQSLLNYSDDLFGYYRDANGAPLPDSLGLTFKNKTYYQSVDPNNIHPNDVSIYYTPVFNELGGTLTLGNYDQIGLHYTNSGMYLQAHILLNHICNERTISHNQAPHTATCCVPDYPPDPLDIADMYKLSGRDAAGAIKFKTVNTTVANDAIINWKNELHHWNTWNPLNTHLRPHSNNNRTMSRMLDADGYVMEPWNQTLGYGYIYGDGTGDLFTNMKEQTGPAIPEKSPVAAPVSPTPPAGAAAPVPPKPEDIRLYPQLFDVSHESTFEYLLSLFWLTAGITLVIFLTSCSSNASKSAKTSFLKALTLTACVSSVALYAFFCDRTPHLAKTQRLFTPWNLFEYFQVWFFVSCLGISTIGAAGYHLFHASNGCIEKTNTFLQQNGQDVETNQGQSGKNLSLKLSPNFTKYNRGSNGTSLQSFGMESDSYKEEEVQTPSTAYGFEMGSGPLPKGQNDGLINSPNSSNTVFTPIGSATQSAFGEGPQGIPRYFSVTLSTSLLGELKGLCVSLLVIAKLSGLEVLKNRFEGHLLVKWIEGGWLVAEMLSFGNGYYLSQTKSSPGNTLVTETTKYFINSIMATILLPMALVLTLGSKSTIYTEPSFFFFYEMAVKVIFWKTFWYIVLNLVSGRASFFEGAVLQKVGVNLNPGQANSQIQFVRLTGLVSVAKWLLNRVNVEPDSRLPYSTDIYGTVDAGPLLANSPASLVYIKARTSMVSAVVNLVRPDFWIICSALIFCWASHCYIVDSWTSKDYDCEKECEKEFEKEELEDKVFGVTKFWSKPGNKLALAASFVIVSLVGFLFLSGYFSGQTAHPLPKTILPSANSVLTVSRPLHLGRLPAQAGGSFVDHMGKIRLPKGSGEWELKQAIAEQNTLHRIWAVRHPGQNENYNTQWYTVSVLAGVASWVIIRQKMLEITKRRRKGTWGQTEYWYFGGWIWLGSISFEMMMLLPHILLAGDGTTRLFILSKLMSTGNLMSDESIQTFIGHTAGVAMGTFLEYNKMCAVQEQIRDGLNIIVAGALFLGLSEAVNKLTRKFLD